MHYRSIAVFCGSQMGAHPIFEQHAREIGNYLGRHEITLIYGGGKKGLMGAVADATLDSGGKVMGIIPELLIGWEIQHTGLTDLQIVADMHARKKIMYDKCDAAIILPGGHGTLDEMFEMLTWNTLKIHSKTLIILNTNGYYNNLMAHMDQMFTSGFLYENWRERIAVCSDPTAIFRALDEGRY